MIWSKPKKEIASRAFAAAYNRERTGTHCYFGEYWQNGCGKQ
jgi:hypothetical protein